MIHQFAQLWPTVVGVIIAVFAGGIVKGIISIGLPLVAIPVVTMFVDLKVAIALLMVPMVCSNLLLAIEGKGTLMLLRRFAPLLVALAAGTLIGTALFAALDSRILELSIGPLAIVFSTVSYFHPNFEVPAKSERWLGPLIGLFSGVIGGMSTFFGPALAAYVVGLKLQRDIFVKSISMIYVCAASSLLLGGVTHGYAGPKLLMLSGLAMIPVYTGMRIGALIRRRIDPERFRIIVLVAIWLGGANLVRLGLGL